MVLLVKKHKKFRKEIGKYLRQKPCKWSRGWGDLEAVILLSLSFCTICLCLALAPSAAAAAAAASDDDDDDVMFTRDDLNMSHIT